MQTDFDVLILGSGPIGASTAYFLSRDSKLKIGVVTQDPTEDHSATYAYAGGSVRWFWDDELKRQMTKETADFLLARLDEGIDLSANRDNYLFLHRGKFVPSINISGIKLVNWLLDQAAASGVEVARQHQVASVTKTSAGYEVKTNQATFTAKKVLLALGMNNSKFMPDYELGAEKRQLFVLDLPIGEDEMKLPHIIAPLGDGVVYTFIKQTAAGWRLLVGQEDVIEGNDKAEAEDYFSELLQAGLATLMPFVAKAKVENILWGIDAGNKTLKLEESAGLFAANCGSAVRSCVWIGRTVAERLQ